MMKIDWDDVEACEFFPDPTMECPVCDCGSDISGTFVCTKRYSKTCEWAILERAKRCRA